MWQRHNQFHGVTDRPPTAIGKADTAIPISYACTANFFCLGQRNHRSNDTVSNSLACPFQRRQVR